MVLGSYWGHVELYIRVHVGLGTKAQMNTPFLGHVGPCWPCEPCASVGPCWALGPCWGHVGPCWAHVGKNGVFLFGHDQPQKEHAVFGSLGLGTKAQMHAPFLGHVGAMLDLRFMFVRTCGVPDLHLLGSSAFISLARAQKNF